MPKSGRARRTRGISATPLAGSSSEHVPEQRLERYAIIGHLPEPELSSVEEHLLACSICQDRLAGIDAVRAALDEGAAAGKLVPAIPFWQAHQTPDGLVRLWVEAADDNWAACLRGRELDCRFTYRSARVAKKKIVATFRALYPDHRCRPPCVPPRSIGRG